MDHRRENQGMLEETKGVIRRRKSKMDRQYNGQKKEDNMRNNDLRNTTQKPKIKQTLNTLQIKIFQLIRPHPLTIMYFKITVPHAKNPIRISCRR
jgi:hypothetical protein